MKKILQAMEDSLDFEEEIVLADGFEEAFIGIARQFNKPFAVYDREKCLDILEKDMPYEEAMEYFSYNVEGAYMGEQTPAFLSSPS
jgi:hypothetical protein